MEHKILLDSKGFKEKPTDKEAGVITNRIFKCPIEMDITMIAQYCGEEGHTIKPSLLTGSTNDTFKESSLVVFDIDNGRKVNGIKKRVPDNEYVTIDDFKDKCDKLGIDIALIYKTFGHTKDWHRFRVILQLDEVITSRTILKGIYDSFKRLFPFIDHSVGLSSLIYGGKGIALLNETAVINTSKWKNYELDDTYIKKMDNMSLRPAQAPEIINKNKVRLIDEHLISKYGNKCFNTFREVTKYLKRINLAEVLSISNPAKFKCIYCDDNKPSAGIVINSDEEYSYVCKSGCAHIKRDIFDIVNIVLKFDKDEEMNNAHIFIKSQQFLMKELKIRVKDEEWMNSIFFSVRENRAVINKKRLIEEKYPTLHSRLKHGSMQRMINAMLNIQEESIMTLPLKSQEGKPIFAASLRRIADLTGLSDHSGIKKKIDELVIMGLVERVSDDVAKKAHKKGYETKLNMSRTKGYKYTTQYYSIPWWTEDLLENAEVTRREAKEKGFTVAGMSQRAAIATTGIQISTKEEYKESDVTSEYIKTMATWVTSTLRRKNNFLKEDFLKYAKSKTIGKRLAETILPVIVAALELDKIVVKKKDLENPKNRLSSKDLRKTAYIKK